MRLDVANNHHRHQPGKSLSRHQEAKRTKGGREWMVACIKVERIRDGEEEEAEIIT